MKCPWCWKPIAILKEARNPESKADAPIDGGLNICAACHRFSIIMVLGGGLRLRKPTIQEAINYHDLQEQALALDRGRITPDAVDQVMLEIWLASGRGGRKH